MPIYSYPSFLWITSFHFSADPPLIGKAELEYVLISLQDMEYRHVC